MKSFFKKLAFVMALAMVVSLAAPAAQSAFAATAVRICYQNTNTEVTSIVMEVGQEDVVDLCFKGAPSDWKNYKWSWKSSNENVATVNKDGIVTPHADGMTTISLVTDCDVVTSPVVVTVGNVKSIQLGTSKTNTFTAKEIQKSDTSVDLNFYGITDWNGGKNYECQWVSTDMKVATVNKVGKITPVAAGTTAIWFMATNTVNQTAYAAKVDVTIMDSGNYSFKAEQVDMETIKLTFAEGTDMSTAKEEDFVFITVNEESETAEVKAEKITAEKNVVTVTFAEGILKNGTSLVVSFNDKQASVNIAMAEEKLASQQLTATTVLVRFVNKHNFDATGTEAGNKTIKIYRKFTTEEMAKMGNKNELRLDEEGNGYQAYYVKDTSSYKDDLTSWVIEGYNAFVDGATYTVVYGDNETSSTLNGVKQDFVAYVGKVDYIRVTATDATVENDVEPAIAAVLTTRLYNSHGIDLTDYYNDADEATEYEIAGDAKIDVSISNNEVTFDEAGVVQVKGTYTFYDEEKEEDVSKSATVAVRGGNYSSYKVEAIYNWTLASGYKDKWSATTTEMIAGDSDQLYVIVKDNRGNYYSNVPGIRDKNYYIGGKQVLEIGDDVDDTPFEQYGYELVFDSLDPDSMLVDEDGAVETYKKTNSFAVVSYRNTNTENAKLHEIGVMGIKVTEARKLKSVSYKNGTSFTILKETEAEDGTRDFYNGYSDFKTSATLEVEFLNQYGKTWGANAVDYYDTETNFTVTTTRSEFDQIAENIANDLNDSGKYIITPAMFANSTATSVTFKIRESATGNSQTVTIKLDTPKYTDDGDVYVDPERAILDAGNVEMYTTLETVAKLFQVSKATQKVGYFRIGSLEKAPIDDKHGYYVGNDLPKNFVVRADSDVINFATEFVTGTGTGSALATPSALEVGDYILVVTDPSGKVFPVQGEGGNGKSFSADSLLGIVPNSDNTGYELVLAAVKANGEMEYAATGTYRATVYKVTGIVDNKNTSGDVISTKYNTTRVSSDAFTVTKDIRNLVFYHQEMTKDVEVSEFRAAAADGTPDASILQAIAETMTFRFNGKDIKFETDGTATYQSYMKFNDGNSNDYHNLKIEIASVDYKVQNSGKRAVIDTMTVKIYTPVGGYYLSKVKVNRSVNVAD